MRLIVVLSLFLSSCASLPALAPQALRTKQYETKTKLTKGVAFKKSQEWFAKTFKDSTRVIQLADASSGKIIGKGNVDCDLLNEGRTHSMHEMLTFTVTSRVDNNVANVTFEDVRSMSVDGQWQTNRPSTQTESEKIFKQCIEPVKESLFSAYSAG